MCINQKELKQNKISEMDGVYHHSKTIQRESSQLVPDHLQSSPKMAGNLSRQNVNHKSMKTHEHKLHHKSRIQTNASFEILLLGRHPPWLAKRMARASSSPLILVILVITKTCSISISFSHVRYT